MLSNLQLDISVTVPFLRNHISSNVFFVLKHVGDVDRINNRSLYYFPASPPTTTNAAYLPYLNQICKQSYTPQGRHFLNMLVDHLCMLLFSIGHNIMPIFNYTADIFEGVLETPVFELSWPE